LQFTNPETIEVANDYEIENMDAVLNALENYIVNHRSEFQLYR